MLPELWLLLPLFLIASFLYSSVGHGGASAYLAISALVGLSRDEIAPIALMLNIVVAGMGFWNYWRAGHFNGRLLLPFVITSAPAAFLGGSLTISPRVFAALLGVTLLLAAARLLGLGRELQPQWEAVPKIIWPVGLGIGCALGLLAGLIGVGGGIFLSPLLLFLSWADAKRTAAVSSAFIVLNSVSGLLGQSLRHTPQWGLALPLLASVIVGSGLGSRLGAQRFSSVLIQRLLGAVLLVASFKLLQQALAG
jgi:uncharacterized membrane protein YfcA